MPEFRDFEGVWLLSRQIDDRKAGQVIGFEGEAVFIPDGRDVFVYEETGQMILPDRAPMQATRRYIWRRVEGGIDVFFDDGRFFHSIAGGRTPTAHHDCPPDIYDVEYEFGRWPEWRVRWVVSGPRKDYRLDGSYRPKPV